MMVSLGKFTPLSTIILKPNDVSINASNSRRLKQMKIIKVITATLVLSLMLNINPAIAQPSTRDPHTPGYVTATELPDGTIPSPSANGNFIIGPTHNPAPESIVHTDVPQGTIYKITMESK